MATIYGIRNCDTVRKARRWLDAHAIECPFHDLRADGLDAARLDRWLAAVGDEVLVNRRSRTWRELPAATREAAEAAALRTLLLEQPTLLRRPVLETGGEVVVGFDAGRYARLFGLPE